MTYEQIEIMKLTALVLTLATYTVIKLTGKLLKID